MLTEVQVFYFFAVLGCVFLGGYLPLARPEQARSTEGFPKGEAFSSGVFLALALIMLLPASLTTFRQVWPDSGYPVASVITIAAFVILLAVEHLTGHIVTDALSHGQVNRVPAIIPIVMTGMIAVPSFFLGAALGISDPLAAFMIFVAIVLHKGTAAFALALAMTRSELSRVQTFGLFSCFALSTPTGIVLGSLARESMGSAALFVKAMILALGAGTFLYMGTLHEMKRASLIDHCCKLNCFLYMMAGVFVTALARWVIGEAHHF